MLASLVQMYLAIDVRDVVPTVHVPALVLHRRHDRLVNIGNGRWLAEHLPNARLVELAGDDHTPWYQDRETLLSEVQEFLTGSRYAPESERTLATVVFTDIVDSTRTAAEMGDRRWREILERHQGTVRDALGRSGGREVKSIGDGFLAVFDGPARAIRCTRVIVDASAEQGIRVRAGVHTGECEVMGDDIGGIAVHIAARVSALAGPGEVLVSRTVKDLVAGSGINFSDRGAHTLKGVPDTWQLYAAE
jgi:class 3 adenylate cyclase